MRTRLAVPETAFAQSESRSPMLTVRLERFGDDDAALQ
jgi:hypothetical protein